MVIGKERVVYCHIFKTWWLGLVRGRVLEWTRWTLGLIQCGQFDILCIIIGAKNWLTTWKNYLCKIGKIINLKTLRSFCVESVIIWNSQMCWIVAFMVLDATLQPAPCSSRLGFLTGHQPAVRDCCTMAKVARVIFFNVLVRLVLCFSVNVLATSVM